MLKITNPPPPDNQDKTLTIFPLFMSIVVLSYSCTLVAYIANNMNPDQTAHRSSLIRVHSVCLCEKACQVYLNIFMLQM